MSVPCTAGIVKRGCGSTVTNRVIVYIVCGLPFPVAEVLLQNPGGVFDHPAVSGKLVLISWNGASTWFVSIISRAGQSSNEYGIGGYCQDR